MAGAHEVGKVAKLGVEEDFRHFFYRLLIATGPKRKLCHLDPAPDPCYMNRKWRGHVKLQGITTLRNTLSAVEGCA